LKAILVLAAALIGSSVFAKDFNLGYVVDGKDLTRVSFQITDSQVKVRVAPNYDEVKCSTFRQELCQHESDVKVVEIVFDKAACRIDKTSLALCNLDASGVATVILNDGSTISLNELFGMVKINEVTSIDDIAAAPATLTKLHVEVWGSRADGLDPLIQMQDIDDLFIQSRSLEEVGTSLF
jgi:hypothetical protein